MSDAPYKAGIGTSKELKPEFPANFIAETTDTEMAVMGDGIESPNANKTYYRVVAVDSQGKRSGPSDYATAPRPTAPAPAPQALQTAAARSRSAAAVEVRIAHFASSSPDKFTK